jgi:hypothetical protein
VWKSGRCWLYIEHERQEEEEEKEEEVWYLLLLLRRRRRYVHEEMSFLHRFLL